MFVLSSVTGYIDPVTCVCEQIMAYIRDSSSSRMRVMNHNWSVVSHETASSSAECSGDKPPFSFVRGQVGRNLIAGLWGHTLSEN